MEKLNKYYKNKYEIGQQVSFVYTNSVHKVVRAYGKIVDYKGRYYYIRVASDMPIMRVYCNKVKKDYFADDFIKLPEPEKDKNKLQECEKKMTSSFPDHYEHLEKIIFNMWFGALVVLCVLGFFLLLK
ncbi:MAG: hypothetical protein J6S67_25405 [Methanobrevibacter sp.]|nr:hypothetical protein [Methanobrevibacter sp.]